MVYGHNEYHDGKYTYIPTHTAEAPRPTDSNTQVYWVAPGYVRGQSGYQSGHWSTEAGIETKPVK